MDLDRSGEITAAELKQALINGNWSQFNDETCRLMISKKDKIYYHIGSTPSLLYFDLYLNTAYAAHYVTVVTHYTTYLHLISYILDYTMCNLIYV